MKKLSMILEYPIEWNIDKNTNHSVFLNNLIKVIMNKEINLTLITVPWPSYGIKRENLSHNILLAFHSYDMPENGWTYKEAPIKGLYSIDRNGYSGWSDICINYEKYKNTINKININTANKIIEKYRNKIKNGMTKYDQNKVIEDLPSEYIFYALQVRTDSVVEKTYLDSLDVLEKLGELAKNKKKYIVIKQHPWCKSSAVYTAIHNITNTNPYVIVSKNDVTKLIDSAQAVIAANSGVSLEALICEKPVFSFGESEWVTSTFLIKELCELENIFNEKSYIPPNVKLIVYLLDQYWVPMNDEEKISKKINELLSDTNKKIELILEDPDIKYQNMLLKYQKEYTIKYNKLREIEADYNYLNRKIEIFKSLLKTQNQIIYFFSSLFSKITNLTKK